MSGEGVDDLFRLFDAGRPSMFSQDPNITPQETQANFGPSGWYGGHDWSSNIGQANMVDDPLLNAFGSTTSWLTTTPDTLLNGRWRGHYVLNSGSDPGPGSPAGPQIYQYYARGSTSPSNVLSSAIVAIRVGAAGTATGAFNIDVYLYPKNPTDFWNGYWTAPYLIGGFKNVYEAAYWNPANVTMNLYAQLYEATGGVIAETALVIPPGVTDNEILPVYTWFDTANWAADKSVRMRFRLNIAKTASTTGRVGVNVGEPFMHYNYQPEPLLFQPAVGGLWTPEKVGGWYPSDSAQYVVTTTKGTDSYPQFTLVASGEQAWGPGSGAGDTKLRRVAAGSLQIDDDVQLKAETAPGTPPTGYGQLYFSSSDKKLHAIDDAGTDTALGGSLTDHTHAASGSGGNGGGNAIDLNAGTLRVPVGSSALTTTEGYFGYQSALERVRVYDGQRERGVTSDGWQPYAYPIGGSPTDTSGATRTLPVNGGSIAIPIQVTGHMLLESMSYYATGAFGSTEWRLYEQYLNNGNSGENTLSEIISANGTATGPGGAGTVTSTSAGVAYLPPGLYWLVLRCTDGVSAASLGEVAAGSMASNTCQTKTLGSALGSTLDFVAATWTKIGSLPLVRLNGRVFGQTSAF